MNGYDLHSGELKREVPLGNIFKTNHHHRCYRNKATTRYVLASRRGTEFVDLVDGQHSVHNWVRGTCHMGMVPANGLQYAPPHPCQCYLDEKLNALNALAPKTPSELRTVEGQPTTAEGQRLIRGPAYGKRAANVRSATAADWPTFRADAARRASVATQLPTGMKLLWRKELGDRVAPPIAVGQQVFVPLVDEHQLIALDAASGEVQWRFTAGARIDSPPSYDRGAVLFGSTDGSVYRVQVSDGSLAWRFRRTWGSADGCVWTARIRLAGTRQRLA